ncbi:hypothetical protein B0H65DRAFT_441443 [Neurospora tetraspora]|uniref:Uncharacterized protein n=1 Tax=Neurospora tetraspora TaxID=94610 RepID=A0AAE0JH83_9PEZI|nr:hypothetical protein B0H65DRAFT_441443 [Neurospora tetraspora]
MTSYPYHPHPSHPASTSSPSAPSPSPSQRTLRIAVPDSPSYSRSRSRPPSPSPIYPPTSYPQRETANMAGANESRCGRPWAAHDNGDGGGGGSGDTSSIQEDLHFTVKLSDTDTGAITSPHAEASGTGSGSYSSQQGWGAREGDQDAEQQSGNHDDGSSNDQGWFRTAVYGLEGLNRLRSPRGNDTTSDQGQRLYSTPKTTICGACGRDRQLEHDWRNYYRAKCSKVVDEESEEISSNGEKTTGNPDTVASASEEKYRVATHNEEEWGSDRRDKGTETARYINKPLFLMNHVRNSPAVE